MHNRAVLKLTDDHPDGEPCEGERVEAEHQVDVDEDAQDGNERDTGNVETGRACLREPKGKGDIEGRVTRWVSYLGWTY